AGARVLRRAGGPRARAGEGRGPGPVRGARLPGGEEGPRGARRALRARAVGTRASAPRGSGHAHRERGAAALALFPALHAGVVVVHRGPLGEAPDRRAWRDRRGARPLRVRRSLTPPLADHHVV